MSGVFGIPEFTNTRGARLCVLVKLKQESYRILKSLQSTAHTYNLNDILYNQYDCLDDEGLKKYCIPICYYSGKRYLLADPPRPTYEFILCTFGATKYLVVRILMDKMPVTTIYDRINIELYVMSIRCYTPFFDVKPTVSTDLRCIALFAMPYASLPCPRTTSLITCAPTFFYFPRASGISPFQTSIALSVEHRELLKKECERQIDDDFVSEYCDVLETL